MERVVCKKCGSIDYEVIKKGVHTGLYCKDCGKWIKWQKKKEIIKEETTKEQYEKIEEKRHNLKMLVELRELEEQQVDETEKLFNKGTNFFTKRGREEIKKLIRKYGFDEVYISTEIATSQYYIEDDAESAEKTFNYIARICSNRVIEKEKPIIKDVNYILKAVENNFGIPRGKRYILKEYLLEHMGENDLEKIKRICLYSDSGKEFIDGLREYFEEY